MIDEHRFRAFRNEARQSQVGQLRAVVVIQQHVGTSNVAVHDALAVHVQQARSGAAYLAGTARSACRGSLPASIRASMLTSRTREVGSSRLRIFGHILAIRGLQHDERVLAVLDHADSAHQVGVVAHGEHHGGPPW
jgi:hypothetical protein